jgi:pantoate--beta-alanine ligase
MSVEITETVAATRAAVAAARTRALSIGLVPTMGALHAGHASLLRAAKRETGFTIASIFLNPTQFGPHEDLTRYPRPFARDLEICAAEGVELVFHPEPRSMYPDRFGTYVEVRDLQDVLCGGSRPGHFRGVATVVLKLFNIVQPDVAYFGQKDAQQVRVLEQMVRDLNVPVRLRLCPTVREADGLASSSRNQYLDAAQRRHAAVLYRALEEIRGHIEAGATAAGPLLRRATELIEATPGTRLDYIAAVAYDTLQPVEQLHGKILIALAVYFGTTRLIDNLLLDLP